MVSSALQHIAKPVVNICILFCALPYVVRCIGFAPRQTHNQDFAVGAGEIEAKVKAFLFEKCPIWMAC